MPKRDRDRRGYGAAVRVFGGKRRGSNDNGMEEDGHDRDSSKHPRKMNENTHVAGNHRPGDAGRYGRGSRQRGRGFRRGRNDTRGDKRWGRDDDGNIKRQKLTVGNRLREVDVGITEFVGVHDGFSGIIKEKFVDFHVNEIDLNGEIAMLTDQSIPPEPEELENLDDLRKQIPSEIWDQLQTLVEVDSTVTSVDINVDDIDKEQRRVIHAIAKKIPNTISQTIAKDNGKIIVVAKSQKQERGGCKLRTDKRVDWGLRGGNYCHFLLHKVNMDTMDVLNQLATRLRIKSDMFNYAGTKDRRARTTQWISLKKVNPSNIKSAANHVRGAYVGNFKFAKEPLKLGMLSGNRFKIALRNVAGSDEEIEKAMTGLSTNGFINYYGLQRFGTVASIPTHDIGKALLQGKWHDAIELILKPRTGETQIDLVEAREIYRRTKDALAAYNRIHRSDRIEAKLFWGLHICGENNPQGALDWIPRNAALMYIHAYQSFIWNTIVSRRIKELGREPVVGDLVYENPNFRERVDAPEYVPNDDEARKEAANNQPDITLNDEALEKQHSSNVESAEITAKHDTKTETVEDVCENEQNSEPNGKINTIAETTDTDGIKKIAANIDKNKDASTSEMEKEALHDLPSVKILTEQDLPNYKLADIVMPQPGWRVTYPTYAKPWFDEILAKDGLSTDLRQKNKKYTLGGAYRKIMEVPSDVVWKIMRYNDRNHEFILTDVDQTKKPEPKEDPEGKYRALIIELSLRPSTYATMALREILKCDTSPATQAMQSATQKALDEQETQQTPPPVQEYRSDDAHDGDDAADDTSTTKVIASEEKDEQAETSAECFQTA